MATSQTGLYSAGYAPPPYPDLLKDPAAAAAAVQRANAAAQISAQGAAAPTAPAPLGAGIDTLRANLAGRLGGTLTNPTAAQDLSSSVASAAGNVVPNIVNATTGLVTRNLGDAALGLIGGTRPQPSSALSPVPQPLPSAAGIQSIPAGAGPSPSAPGYGATSVPVTGLDPAAVAYNTYKADGFPYQQAAAVPAPAPAGGATALHLTPTAGFTGGVTPGEGESFRTSLAKQQDFLNQQVQQASQILAQGRAAPGYKLGDITGAHLLLQSLAPFAQTGVQGIASTYGTDVGATTQRGTAGLQSATQLAEQALRNQGEANVAGIQGQYGLRREQSVGELALQKQLAEQTYKAGSPEAKKTLAEAAKAEQEANARAIQNASLGLALQQPGTLGSGGLANIGIGHAVEGPRVTVTGAPTAKTPAYVVTSGGQTYDPNDPAIQSALAEARARAAKQ